MDLINHVVLVLDASDSMTRLKSNLIKVADNQVGFLAQRSKELDQETRITVYSFNSWSGISCLIYDKDVLRMPSISSLYKTDGATPLRDAVSFAIDDLKLTPEKYGEHAFLIYVLTDGLENASAKISSSALSTKIANLPDHWTVAVFVPDQTAKFEAQKHGFHKDNIDKWDTTAAGIAEVGETIRKTTESFMQGRTQGVRGYKSLFTLNTLSTDEIKKNLTPVAPHEYRLYPVLADSRADQYCVDMFGSYKNGQVYYELVKTEEVQEYKQVAIFQNGTLYSGKEARTMLGLPDSTVKVNPTSHPGYRIFVQSTAPNRKLTKGSSVLVMTGNVTAQKVTWA
jgi:hypothetical protein